MVTMTLARMRIPPLVPLGCTVNSRQVPVFHDVASERVYRVQIAAELKARWNLAAASLFTC
jgi:hypothetical protein